VRSRVVGLGVAPLLVLLCACTAAQVGVPPPVKNAIDPISGSTLQFAVGTANLNGTVGLNVVETLRQNTGPNIGTSVLTNAPTIIAPSTFVVPMTPDAGLDAGGNKMTGTLQTSLASPPPVTTFDPSGTTSSSGGSIQFLATSWGFLPSVLTNPNNPVNLIPAAMPFYLVPPTSSSSGNGTLSTTLSYIGGPPAFAPPGHTSTQDGTFPPNYPGYELGIGTFQAVPVGGTYTLSVVIPISVDQNGVKTGTKTATATLGNLASLTAWTTPPTLTLDGNGGGTVTTNFTGGSGITDEFIEIRNNGPALCQKSGAAPFMYTLRVAPGAPTVALPDTIGAAPPGTAQPHTICSAADNSGSAGSSQPGDTVSVYGFAVDYPLAQAGFPRSQGQVTPRITGAGGQADITVSDQSSVTASAFHRRAPRAIPHPRTRPT
jgi:hypothetical protein